ncbi:MAG: hypothetical protein AB3N14_13820 [Flavobacteriaceae bacterium]
MRTAEKFPAYVLLICMLLLSACGKDGKDGNANVQTYILNISDETEFDVSLSLPLPELTQEVIDNDLVVVYARFENDPILYALPRAAMPASNHPEAFSIAVGLDPQRIILLFREPEGAEFSIFSDQLEQVKVVIAEATNTTTRTVTGNL